MIIIPMPIIQENDTGKEDIDNMSTRNEYVNGPSSYDSKVSYLDREKETIMEALKHNEELKKELESGNLLESMIKEKKYYKKLFKRNLICSISSYVILSLLFVVLSYFVQAGLIFTLSITGFITLLSGIFMIPLVRNSYLDYKDQNKYILEYAEKFDKDLYKSLKNDKQNKLERKKVKLNEKKEVLKDNKQEIDSTYRKIEQYKELDLLLREKYNLTTDLNEKKELIEKIKENYIKMSSIVKNEDKQSSMKLTLK